MLRLHLLLSLLLSLLAFNFSFGNSLKNNDWTNSELVTIKSLLIKKLKPRQSISNKYYNSPQAVLLGKRLFNDPSLSYNQQVSCSSCHIKTSAFSDNKTTATGAKTGIRNTPTLFNVDQQNWFFWDGRADSLWAQALGSLENPAEHNITRTELLHFISKNKSYKEQYQRLFNEKLPSINELLSYPHKAGPNSSLFALKSWKKLTQSQREKINKVFSNVGKAIAAYVATLRSTPTRFDNFAVQLLDNGDSTVFNKSEEKGLKLFISQKIGCINCHSGAVFSNKSFHNIGTGIPRKDNGRSEIVDLIIHDQFNCLGKYSDAKKDQCLELKYLNRNRHALAGSFKTPTLRGISKTQPYMHDGRYKTLEAVLDHYSNIDKSKALVTDLPEMTLSEQDQKDLINFLLTL